MHLPVKRVRALPTGLVILAALAVGLFVALGGQPVIAGPDSAPAAVPPNPGHSWSQIGDLPGTMWHSNNDGPGSGLDADTVDGLQSNQIQDADNYVSNAGYATNAGNADTLDGQHASAFASASHTHPATLCTWSGVTYSTGARCLGPTSCYTTQGNDCYECQSDGSWGWYICYYPCPKVCG